MGFCLGIKLYLTILFVICSFTIVINTFETKANLTTLKLVQILFRHGDRTPTRSYPTDPYADVHKYWSDGIGQLTKIGKIQHYNLGKYFRQRYDGFISRNYNPNEIYVLSSDMDRTIMSAEMNLAGLYEPEDSNINWNPTIPWTPVPVRTIPQEEDNLLRTIPCKKYTRLRRELMESDVIQELNKQQREFVHYILRHTGASGTTFGDIANIEDVLQINRFHNYKLPNWADGILDKYHDLAAEYYALSTHTIDMKRLKGGPLWKLLLKNMRKTVSKSFENYSNLKKIYMYSGHDSTLTRLMNTLGVFNNIMPTYAAAFIIELHHDDDQSDYYVQMYYRNQTNSAPYRIEVPGCPVPCSFQMLVDVTAAVIPKNWELECQDQKLLSLLSQTVEHSVLAQAFVIVCSLFLTISILLFVSRKKINSELFQYRMHLPRRIRTLNRESYEII